MAIKHLYVLTILLAGCAGNLHSTTLEERAPISVCDVTSNSAHYIGKPLKLRANYSSDHQHGEVFWDSSCSGKVTHGGYEIKNRDPSVDAFYDSDSKNCKNSLACPAKPQVVVAGTIKSDVDGLYINITKFLHVDIIE